jgi:hypothetical protein
MRPNFWLGVLIISIFLIFPLACKVSPALNVVSLDITPPEIEVGDNTTVNVNIRNTGSTDGTYAAILMVNSLEQERKNIVVPADAEKTASFVIMEDKAGTYKVDVGGLNANLIVKPKLLVKEIELKYDDGEGLIIYQPNSSKPDLIKQTGFLIDFTPPAVPFIINKVLIYGAVTHCPI